MQNGSNFTTKPWVTTKINSWILKCHRRSNTKRQAFHCWNKNWLEFDFSTLYYRRKGTQARVPFILFPVCPLTMITPQCHVQLLDCLLWLEILGRCTSIAGRPFFEKLARLHSWQFFLSLDVALGMVVSQVRHLPSPFFLFMVSHGPVSITGPNPTPVFDSWNHYVAVSPPGLQNSKPNGYIFLNIFYAIAF